MYRSKDINFMNDLKIKINELNYNAYSESEFANSWEQMRKYIVLDDLNEFLREKYIVNQIPYLSEYVFNYNTTNPDFMFVTLSENKLELDTLDTIIAKSGITNYYRTSYMKFSDTSRYQSNQNLNQVIMSEIKLVQPKVVIFFGLLTANCIAQLISVNSSNLHKQMNIQGLPPIMITSSLLDLYSNNLNTAQINTLKHYIWCDIMQYATK